MKMDRAQRERLSSAAMVSTLWLTVVCFALLALSTAFAADPAWWSTRGAVQPPGTTTTNGSFTQTYATNNYAGVTQGQLKYFTARAVDELNAHLSGGAGTNLNAMVTGWRQDYSTNNYSNAANPGAPFKPSDYSGVNVGQLKYIGKQVWSQLTNAGYAPSLPTWLATADAGDQSGAVIGQLKTVFNFDTTTFLAAPHIISATTASGTVGTAFSYTLTANNTPTSYAVSGLPAGLSFNATTRGISGTPTVAGVFPIGLSASNSSGTGYGTLTLTVVLSAPVITSATTATATTGTAFTYTIVASKTPTSFNATGLPAGLTVNTATGVISGTPTTAAVSTVTLSATNAGGTGTKTLTLTVKQAIPVISSLTTASGITGTTFTYAIVASNSPTSFNATGLSAGLTVNTTTGVISGTPTTAAVSTITLSATNAGGTGTRILTLTVKVPAPVISSTATATGTVGTPFTYAIAATNTPTSFNATGLPTGLTINTTTGVIAGTPTTVRVSTVTLSAINAGGTGTKALALTINPALPVMTSATTATGKVGTAFSYTLVATNTPTSYNATGLPAGLTFNATTHVISGTPTTAAISTISLSATNVTGTGTQSLTLTINPPSPVISSLTTASGTTGTAFTYTIVASNTPTSYSASGLPAGLTVNTTTGVISGTPTTAATSSIILSALNAGGTGTKVLTLTVKPPVPVITSAATAFTTKGVAFTYSIIASNSPTSYSATGLPAGLTLNTTTGLISGSPTSTSVANVNVTLRAINTGGTGAVPLVLTLNPPTSVTNLVATVGSSAVTLNWTDPTSTSVTSLSLQRSTDEGTTWSTLQSLAASATSFTDTTVQTGLSYDYQVVSSTSSGIGSVPTTLANPVAGGTIPRFAVIDLGTQSTIVGEKLTNSGYVLGYSQVWENGNFIKPTGLNASDECSIKDISEDGTLIGTETTNTEATYYPETVTSYNGGTYTYTDYEPVSDLAIWSPGSLTPTLTPGPIATTPFIGSSSGNTVVGYIYTGQTDYNGVGITSAHGIISLKSLYPPNFESGFLDLFKYGQELGTSASWTNDEYTTGSSASLITHNNQGDLVYSSTAYNNYVESFTTYLNNSVLDFTPKAMSNEVTVSGATKIYAVGVDGDQIVWWDGASHRNLGVVTAYGSPIGINAATATIQDSNGNSVVVPAVQMVDTFRLWEMDPKTGQFKAPQLLQSLVPPNSSWRVFGYVSANNSAINDNGAIVGTATYSGTNTAIASGSHGIMLCPCAVVSDPSNTYLPNENSPVLTYVRFGLWDHAFDTASPPNVLNGNSESGNFVGSDTRRFYIRVYDPSATTTTVTADWYTQTSTGADDDHPATDTVTLTRSSTNPAVYVSKALMLVTDEVDNGQSTNTGLSGGGNANEGQADHRLRRAALGDTMCYAYTPAAANQTKSTFTVPIFGPAGSPDAIKNLTVQFVKATGGLHNANTVNQTIVSNMEAQIATRYALAGIKVNCNYNDAVDAINVPTSIDLGAVVPGSAAPSTADEAVMIQLLRAKYGAYTSTNKTIYLIVIGEYNTPGLSGESYPPYLAGTYPNAVDCCFVTQLNTRPGNLVVEPHEMGHVLLNRVLADQGPNGDGHYVGLNSGQNLMSAGATDLGSVVGSKRLWDDPAHNDGVHDYQIDYMRLSPLLY